VTCSTSAALTVLSRANDNTWLDVRSPLKGVTCKSRLSKVDVANPKLLQASRPDSQAVTHVGVPSH